MFQPYYMYDQVNGLKRVDMGLPVNTMQEVNDRVEEYDGAFDLWLQACSVARRADEPEPPLPERLRGWEGCDVFCIDLETGQHFVNIGDDIWEEWSE